ncbi:cytochrome c-like [Argonauta hians]
MTLLMDSGQTLPANLCVVVWFEPAINRGRTTNEGRKQAIMKLFLFLTLLCLTVSLHFILVDAEESHIFKRAVQDGRMIRVGKRLYGMLKHYLLLVCGTTDKEVGLMDIVSKHHFGKIYHSDELRKVLASPKRYFPGTKLIFFPIKKKSEFESVLAYFIYLCKNEGIRNGPRLYNPKILHKLGWSKPKQ